MAMKLSRIFSTAKKAIIGLEGRVTRSEFYLTNLTNTERIQLCMTPEEVKARTETNFRTYNIIEKGEIKFPKGEKLTSLSWNGILPGANILASSFVTHTAWESPRELVKAISRWREAGDKIKVLITQTPINMDVYIKDFDYELSGGQGNIKYSLNLIAAKEIKVMTVEEADKARQAAKEQSAQELKNRAAMKSRTGARISKLNNIWSITQLLRGNGGDWQQIAAANSIGDPTDLSGRDIIWC